jgi:hypothetical protein
MGQLMADDEVGMLAEADDPTVRRLAEEVLRLRAAIAAHSAKRGHELCWLNDLELWKAVGIDVGYPHDSLPVREEFLAQCQRYYASRVSGSPYEEPSTSTPVTAP